LKEFAISCFYQPGSMLFGGVDEEVVGCIHDRAGAKIISTLSKSVGFPKLEKDISCYRRPHIIGSVGGLHLSNVLKNMADMFSKYNIYTGTFGLGMKLYTI
jgi:hypothetical protein